MTPAALGRVTLASSNAGKLRELRALGGDRLSPVLPPDDAPAVTEDGATYLANARLKAQSMARHTQGWALADDSGLEVDALNGRPGIHSARFGGPGLDDAGRCQHLLDALGEGVDRAARFRCVLVLAHPDGREFVAEGTLEGAIALGAAGAGGFGYDPVFEAARLGGRSLAVVAPEEKAAISHRAVAMRALLAALEA
jgi:XTP/dITP diphosphohydrolase